MEGCLHFPARFTLSYLYINGRPCYSLDIKIRLYYFILKSLTKIGNV